jgi:hypothetical protein
MHVDDDLRQRLAEFVCPHCAAEGRETVGAFALVGFDYPAFGRVVCGHTLGQLLEDLRERRIHHLDWLQKPKEIAKARRRTKTFKVTDATDRCEICLRGAVELHEPAKLTVHHVVEVQHGGEDDDTNRRVYCSDCQSIVHSLRRAFGRPYAE